MIVAPHPMKLSTSAVYTPSCVMQLTMEESLQKGGRLCATILSSSNIKCFQCRRFALSQSPDLNRCTQYFLGPSLILGGYSLVALPCPKLFLVCLWSPHYTVMLLSPLSSHKGEVHAEHCAKRTHVHLDTDCTTCVSSLWPQWPFLSTTRYFDFIANVLTVCIGVSSRCL